MTTGTIQPSLLREACVGGCGSVNYVARLTAPVCATGVCVWGGSRSSVALYGALREMCVYAMAMGGRKYAIFALRYGHYPSSQDFHTVELALGEG